MSALVGEAYVEDALPKDKTKIVQDELVDAFSEKFVADAGSPKDMTLQEHDRIHHKGGFDPSKDSCKFRDKLKEETSSDKADEVSLHRDEKHGLSEVADRIKSFIKGVSIKFSDKPYEEESGDVRKSIKQSEQDNWNRILDAFEQKTEGADSTWNHKLLDHPPAVLRRLGVEDLPVTVRGGVIHKMMGDIKNSEYDYHDIPISELRNLLIDLDNPVAVFDSKSDPNAFVVLTNVLDRNGNFKSVVPLKLDRPASGQSKENVIASAYGQDPKNLQRWIDEGYLRYVSKKALKKSAQRLQLPRDSILKTRGVLMEDAFSAEQLGEIIPDSPSAVKGAGKQKKDVGEVISFRDDKGEVVGTYNRNTNEVVLYPGADADTIGHELCGHATWQYAEQQARKGDDTLIKKMNEVVDSPTAKPVWDEVKANYEGEDREVQREEVWAHIVGHETSKAVEEIQKSRGGRRWYQKFLNVLKDAWKGLLSTVRINSVHLEETEEMSPKEFSEYIVKQMIGGKTLGSISKGDGGEEGEERKSVRSKTLVTPEEDMAYLESVQNGDMDTAAKMVRDVAARAFPNTKVLDKDGKPKMVFHGTPNKFTEFDYDKIGTTTDQGLMGQGFYFSDHLDTALGYARKGGDKKGSVLRVFLNLEQPICLTDFKSKEEIARVLGAYPDYFSMQQEGKLNYPIASRFPDFTSHALNAGYDGSRVKHAGLKHLGVGVDEIVAFFPSQIKSADPVTYDNDGKVIPLSRRFDDGPDIRGDVSNKTEFLEKMKSLHPEVDPEELISRLKGLGSREEMEAEIKKMLGKE